MHAETLQPDLSVVIPYFNQSKQIYGALSDLLEQKDVNLEVLVIDDASPDSCADMVEGFKSKGLHIKLYTQPQRLYTLNCRLLGMREANGEYLAFMDADDGLLSSSAYSRVLAQTQDAKADLLHFVTMQKDENGFLSPRYADMPLSKTPLSGNEIFSNWLHEFCRTHTVWNKLYSRRLYKAVAAVVHDINIIRIEDFYLSAWFFLLAQNYIPSFEAVYKYQPSGIKFLEKSAARAIDALRMYMSLPEKFESNGLPADQAIMLKKYLRCLVTLNGAKMCEFLADNRKVDDINGISEENLAKILQYGSAKEFFLVLAIANASNAHKLIDIYKVFY